MQIIIAFTIGAILGLVFAPKKFSFNITTNDKTEEKRPEFLTEEQINDMIGPESETTSHLDEINKDQMVQSITAAISEVFRGDDLYDDINEN